MKITRKSYKLIKKTSFIALTAAIAINTFKIENIGKIINATHNKEIECTSDSIVFTNPEIYVYLNTKYNLKNNASYYYHNLSNISINNTLTENDFSDLQYFSDLKYLTIRENKVDLSDLANNDKLKSVTLTNCEITNSYFLPSGIEELTLENVTSIDKLSIPSSVKKITLKDVKTPELCFSSLDNLNDFYLSGDLPFDISILKYFSSLKNITLLECPNIYNDSSLKDIVSYPQIKVDGYAPIWLDSDTLSAINCEVDEHMTEEIAFIDQLVGQISLDKSDAEKEQYIINYVLEHLEYDPLVLNKSDAGYDLISFYLKNPISHAVMEQYGTDITYATYFKALANRLGLKSHLVYSNGEYLNQVGDKALNLSKMDLKTSSVTNLKEQDQLNTKTSFDFNKKPNEKESVVIEYNGQEFLFNLETYLVSLVIINLLLKLLFPKKDIIEDEKTYKKINN